MFRMPLTSDNVAHQALVRPALCARVADDHRPQAELSVPIGDRPQLDGLLHPSELTTTPAPYFQSSTASFGLPKYSVTVTDAIQRPRTPAPQQSQPRY
jgi:hypothetical protein